MASSINQELQTIGPNGEVYRPTITPTPNFNPDADAQVLEKAMKGIGTDEKAIVNILGRRTPAERTKIVAVYKSSYGKDLPKQLDKETSGDFGKCLQYLCMPTTTFNATVCREAIKGLGTDEQALIDVICSATNSEIQAIKEEYMRLFKKDLEKDVKDDTSGFFERLLVALLQGQRKELSQEQTSHIFTSGVEAVLDRAEADKAADQLYNAGEGKLGTDESTFIRVVARENVWQLAAIDACYRNRSKKTLREAVKSETSGDFKKALCAVLDFSLDRPATFAYFLQKAMAGLGTNEKMLTRIIVMRAHIDMMEIKIAYQKLYSKSLGDAIKSETSGDYRKILLALIGEG